MDPIERIEAAGELLAIIVRFSFQPDSTVFITPDDAKQQLGFVVYPAGGEIKRHDHVPLERHLIGTSEVLIVRGGRCEVDIYDVHRSLVATRELSTGDILLLIAGGHGFRVIEDTTFIEIKQGPYTGLEEKERF